MLCILTAGASEDALSGDSDAMKRKGMATAAEVDSVFGCVETLFKINQELYEQLCSTVGNESDAFTPNPSEQARIMAAWASGPLRLYAPHVKSFPGSCARLRKLLAERHIFAAAVRVLELQPRTKGLNLQALLVSTVQRLPRYTLLLREILKHTPKDAALSQTAGCDGCSEANEDGSRVASNGRMHDNDANPSSESRPAVSSLQADCDTPSLLKLALDKIRGVTAGVDASVGDAEKRIRTMQVCCDVLRRDDLVAPSRLLLREGILTKLRSSVLAAFVTAPHTSRRDAFLFSDIFVLRAAEGSLDDRATGTTSAARARILPLGSLVIITIDCIRCPSLDGPRVFSYDAPPTDAHLSAIKPAVAALRINPASIEADLGLLIVVAAPGQGKQLLLRASDEAERRSWATEIIDAAEACSSGGMTVESSRRSRPLSEQPSDATEAARISHTADAPSPWNDASPRTPLLPNASFSAAGPSRARCDSNSACPTSAKRRPSMFALLSPRSSFAEGRTADPFPVADPPQSHSSQQPVGSPSSLSSSRPFRGSSDSRSGPSAVDRASTNDRFDVLEEICRTLHARLQLSAGLTTSAAVSADIATGACTPVPPTAQGQCNSSTSAVMGTAVQTDLAPGRNLDACFASSEAQGDGITGTGGALGVDWPGRLSRDRHFAEDVDDFMAFTGATPAMALAFLHDGSRNGLELPDMIAQYFDRLDQGERLATDECISLGVDGMPNHVLSSLHGEQGTVHGQLHTPIPVSETCVRDSESDEDEQAAAAEEELARTAARFASIVNVDKATARGKVADLARRGLSSLDAMLETFFEESDVAEHWPGLPLVPPPALNSAPSSDTLPGSHTCLAYGTLAVPASSTLALPEEHAASTSDEFMPTGVGDDIYGCPETVLQPKTSSPESEAVSAVTSSCMRRESMTCGAHSATESADEEPTAADAALARSPMLPMPMLMLAPVAVAEEIDTNCPTRSDAIADTTHTLRTADTGSGSDGEPCIRDSHDMDNPLTESVNFDQMLREMHSGHLNLRLVDGAPDVPALTFGQDTPDEGSNSSARSVRSFFGFRSKNAAKPSRPS